MLGEGAQDPQPPVRRRRARLELARQIRIQRGDRDVHARQPHRRHRRDQVQVALHAAGLGHQRKGVARLVHQLYHRSRQAQFALHRLVAVRGRADGDEPGLVVLPGHFRAQHLGDVALGNDLGLEVEPRRHVEIAVRRPRVAVDAAVLAAAVGIDRAIEVHVGRVVAADDAARVFPDHFGAKRLARLRQAFLQRVPAVVEHCGGCRARNDAQARWPRLVL